MHIVLWTALRTFSVIGIASTLYWLYEQPSKWRRYTEARRENARKLQLLRNTDHFILHLIHIGGEGSRFNTLTVMGEEEGGYFFNPPSEFVSVGSNRPGDVTVITPSQLSRTEGYVIDAVGSSYGQFQKSHSPDIAYLLNHSMRDEIYVRFAKTASRPQPIRRNRRQFFRNRWNRRPASLNLLSAR